MKTKYISILMIGLFGVIVPFSPSYSQVRAGAGYLKILPGARQYGVAGTIAGALDYTDSFYGNPAATGFLREWQWSASYTNWISDIYNASFLYGQRIRTPWSQRTKLILGINYLNIPEFDSSNELTPPVSGNELLVTSSMGQPINFLTQNLSLGLNFKYYYSELAQFNANSWILDLGLLYRTPNIQLFKTENGLLDYLIISSGIAVNNIGKPITYISEGTPLPRTIRAGVALNLGSHRGLQMNLSTDYRQFRDENGYFSIGSELSWRQLISFRWGYSLEDNLLKHFIFGASLRLDDTFISEKSFLPGRNNALRLDFAANQGNDFVNSPYHGSLSHHPIAPEHFKIIAPAMGQLIDSDSVTLRWETSIDADLYDKVNYWLLVDLDSMKLEKIIRIADEDRDRLFSFLENEKLLINLELTQNNYLLANPAGGDYFWSVFAYDRDQHIQFAEINGQKIARFQVATSNPEVIAIEFQPSQWITEDDYQGIIQFQIKNKGKKIARNLSVQIYDSLTDKIKDSFQQTILWEKSISPIRPDRIETYEFEWRTDQPGFHQITAEITDNLNKNVIHQFHNRFFTIPKGKMSSPDTVIVLKLTNITYELPFVGKIFFDSSSAVVKKEFIREWLIEPPMVSLAKQLKKHPDLKISLQGTVDPNSGENDVQLAEDRAKAVRDSLNRLGVNMNQMELLPGNMLPIRNLPSNPEDARWILEERRRVDITTDEKAEEILFSPNQTGYNERLEMPVKFHSTITSAVNILIGAMSFETDNFADTLDIQKWLLKKSLADTLQWQPSLNNLISDDDQVEKNIQYQFTLKDSLGRQFKTAPGQVYLKTQKIMRERMYFGIAKFALAEPFYNFYWQNLIERLPDLLTDPQKRVRFLGHACAIGSEPINLRLSQKRAELFHQRFISDVKTQCPELYDQIKGRIDPPEAFGETKPFFFRRPNGDTVILGDNTKPLGRQLNRRVMVLFYKVQ